MNQYLIYGLRCPKTDDYKYIGKSSSGLERAKAHLTYSHNESVNHWVAELREQGFCPLIDVLEECTEEDLQVKEHFWIQYYTARGCKLMNSIFYRGAAIEKLEQQVADAQKELDDKLNKILDMIDEMSTIGGFIKFMRKRRGLNQQDLAEMAQITSRTLTDIELGKGNPSYNTIVKILDILGYKLVPTLKTNNHENVRK
jgi:DNA-binding XRE family transcriptional regulator